ncbi:HAMP domain-containing sensor histidine kinase [Paraflavisolibacter sp. H34]|uniref:sensor histidine kinase n=1 Tax=Huijunlia imazamoxiresistens TaxID=3127457 RepID=UPI00301B32B4
MKLEALYHRIALLSCILLLLLTGTAFFVLWRMLPAGMVAAPGFSPQKMSRIMVLAILALTVLPAVLLYLITRHLLHLLWKPFHTILDELKRFDPRAPEPIRITPSSTDEFNELGAGVQLMTLKMIRDYQSLKEFTDHASHEMQTPLAVMNSKLDLFIQAPCLTELQLLHAQAIYEAIGKLSRLSRGLLLLTRIENNQYAEEQWVNIGELVQKKMADLEGVVQTKGLTLAPHLEPIRVRMNRQLAEILLNTLLGNALRHSHKGATILVGSKDDRFWVSNSGRAPLDADGIFRRFYRSQQSDGTGLGLAIARQICHRYGFLLNYEFLDHRHHFSVKFRLCITGSLPGKGGPEN